MTERYTSSETEFCFFQKSLCRLSKKDLDKVGLKWVKNIDLVEVLLRLSIGTLNCQRILKMWKMENM